MIQGNVEIASDSGGLMDQNESAIGTELDISLSNEMIPVVSSNVLDRLMLVERFHMIEHAYDALARQLEYYFSPQNLQSDTYLQTLRELNDGCVPVSIIANFTKVKAILASLIGYEAIESMQKRSNPKQRFLEEEMQRMHAIVHVVNTCYTCNLQIFSIDTQTGKIAASPKANSSSSNMILAVGFLSLHSPAEEPEDAATVDGSNILVLRYVPDMVTEQEIRSLLQTISDCPTILSVVPDVASCWHVALDTWDRSVLIHILVQLRARAYPSCGAPVMVRLYSTDMGILGPAAVLPKKKRKKKKRPKSKKNKASSLSIATTTSTTSTCDPAGDGSTLSPLFLTQDHFPSLLRRHSELEKTEWTTTSVEVLNDNDEDEEDDEDDDEASEESLTKEERYEVEEPKSSSKMGAQHSDTASTATTTSSHASSGFDTANVPNPQQKTAVLSGYAAAVRRNSPENGGTGSTASGEMIPSPASSPTAVPKVVLNATADVVLPDTVAATTTAPATAWGGRNRLSFVDIVRVNGTKQ